MLSRAIMVLGLAAGVAACGTEPFTYESLAGSYSGDFVSADPSGYVYEGQFTLDLSQEEAGVTGTWAVTGQINGGTDSEGTGPFATTIPLGPDPVFTARLSFDFCPDDIMEFDGSLDSSSGALALTGSLNIPSSQCNVLTAYPFDLVLVR